jgi:SAM-dependent methyltransferase
MSADPRQFPITEVPGQRATGEQLSMFLTRYKFASRYCEGKEVLEIACGAGQGLGYLAQYARRVVGGDIDRNVLQIPRNLYRARRDIEVLRLDARRLPFRNESFDVVVLFDAVYWIDDPASFVREARRVLRADGRLLISTVNAHWRDFNPSPYAMRYLTGPELKAALEAEGFRTRLFGAFSAEPTNVKEAVVSAVRRVAIRLNLIPSTIEGKEHLKRLFYGELTPIPSVVDEGMGEFFPPIPLRPGDGRDQYKMLYAEGERGK